MVRRPRGRRGALARVRIVVYVVLAAALTGVVISPPFFRPQAVAEPPPSPPVRVLQTDRSADGAVSLRLAVRPDVVGAHLTQGAFKVTSGGRRLSVRSSLVQPTTWDVGVVLDAGPRDRRLEPALRGAALELAAVLPAGTRMSLFTHVSPDGPVRATTAERDVISRAITGTRRLSGDSHSWAALLQAALRGSATGRETAVVLVSSRARLSPATGVVDGLNDYGVPVYVLWADSAAVPSVLAEAARRTGGLVAAAGRENLVAGVDRVRADLASQYDVQVAAPSGAMGRVMLTVAGSQSSTVLSVSLPPGRGSTADVRAHAVGSKGLQRGSFPRAVLASVLLAAAATWAFLAVGPRPQPGGRHRRHNR